MNVIRLWYFKTKETDGIITFDQNFVVNGGNLPPGLIGPGDLFIGHEGCDLRDFSSQQQWLDWTKSDAFPVGNNCWTYLDFTKAGARTRTRSFFSSPKKKKVSNFCWSSVV